MRTTIRCKLLGHKWPMQNVGLNAVQDKDRCTRKGCSAQANVNHKLKRLKVIYNE